MSKGKLAWWIILLSILAIVFYFKSQQDSQARTKAFEVAVEKAKALGYEVGKMQISQEGLGPNRMVVAFRDKKQSKINNLEIYLRYENIYEIKILGTYKNVDPEKDREKISEELLKQSIEGIKGVVRDWKSGAH